MTGTHRIPLVLGAGIVAVATGIGLWHVGDGFAARTDQGVTSTGSAVITATADTGIWSVTIVASDASMTKAAARVVRALPALRSYFIDAGIEREQITVGSLGTYTTSSESGNPRAEANLSITVRSKTPQLIADLNGRVTELISLATDVNINTNPPSYFLSDLERLRPQVQELAVKDARNRAQVMAAALDVELGSPTAIRSGSITVTPPDSIEGEYGGYDLSTIEKHVRAVVSVTFDVD